MTLAKIQKLMNDIQEARQQPHLHPLPLCVLPEDTVNATLHDGPTGLFPS